MSFERNERISIYRRKLLDSQSGLIAPSLMSCEFLDVRSQDHSSPKSANPQLDYWSVDNEFWRKWRTDETEFRQKTLSVVQSKLEQSQRETAAALLAEEDALRKEAERKKLEEEARTRVEAKESPPHPTRGTSGVQSSSSVIQTQIASTDTIQRTFERLMDEGKQFRAEFMTSWRDISLAVSTTAANSRSIQLSASKIIACLSRAGAQAGPTRTHVVRWLSAVCGSKIVHQATTGNKSLVWSFAYLARVVGESFPDVVLIGVVGETAASGSWTLHGHPGCPLTLNTKDTPKAFESHARLWVAILCTFSDEKSVWAWVTCAIENLRVKQSFLNSTEAMWNLLKVYVFLEVGFHDFRRIFGHQALKLIDLLENRIFSRIDAELQSVPQSNSVSVQMRFYVDACYNILQTRKFAESPEGQVLAAAKESDLNPDL